LAQSVNELFSPAVQTLCLGLGSAFGLLSAVGARAEAFV
jgi:hypothetical protein